MAYRPRRYETAGDLARLQRLLDRSYESAGSHLRSVVNAGFRRTAIQLRPHPLSLSVGFANCDPASPCSIDELLQSGDIPMYEHKRSRSGQSPPAFDRHVGTA